MYIRCLRCRYVVHYARDTIFSDPLIFSRMFIMILIGSEMWLPINGCSPDSPEASIIHVRFDRSTNERSNSCFSPHRLMSLRHGTLQRTATAIPVHKPKLRQPTPPSGESMSTLWEAINYTNISIGSSPTSKSALNDTRKNV
jgi:hypothetical protein